MGSYGDKGGGVWWGEGEKHSRGSSKFKAPWSAKAPDFEEWKACGLEAESWMETWTGQSRSTGIRLCSALRAMVKTLNFILRVVVRFSVIPSKGVLRQGCVEQGEGPERMQGRGWVGRRDRQQRKRDRLVCSRVLAAVVARREQIWHLEYSINIKLCL